ncbi:hypothetical protein HanIR_Chr15g0781841 [Helianthus annuus]|nr:hypothetical protein HanIR_Chr15g0781841 [Helianthus annuus]
MLIRPYAVHLLHESALTYRTFDRFDLDDRIHNSRTRMAPISRRLSLSLHLPPSLSTFHLKISANSIESMNTHQKS